MGQIKWWPEEWKWLHAQLETAEVRHLMEGEEGKDGKAHKMKIKEAAKYISQLFLVEFCETPRPAETEGQFRQRQRMYSTGAAQQKLERAEAETEEEWLRRKEDVPSVCVVC